jgi:hypothetical protein
MYLITTKQLIANITLTSGLFVAFVVLLYSANEYLNLPEVYQGSDGKCVKVVNFKNGDAYSCLDVDQILKKYKVIYVK